MKLAITLCPPTYLFCLFLFTHKQNKLVVKSVGQQQTLGMRVENYCIVVQMRDLVNNTNSLGFDVDCGSISKTNDALHWHI